MTLLATITGQFEEWNAGFADRIAEFWDSVNGGAPQLLTTLQLTPGAAGASVVGTRMHLGDGTHSIHAHYRGDNNWQAGDSPSAAVAGFSVSLSPNPLSFKAGTTGTATVTVNPTGGFTGTVDLSCPAGAAFKLAGYSCSISPAKVIVTGTGPQTAILMLTPTVTVAGAMAVQDERATFWPGAGVMVSCPGGRGVCYRDDDVLR